MNIQTIFKPARDSVHFRDMGFSANYTQALIFHDNFGKSRKTGSISPNELQAAGKTLPAPSTTSKEVG